jgi:hypothetical protein
MLAIGTQSRLEKRCEEFDPIIITANIRILVWQKIAKKEVDQNGGVRLP